MSQRILIVDDEVDTLESLRDFLEMKDYDVLTSASLAEGRAEYAQEDPDAVLLDLGLPDGDGLEWIPELRASSPHLGIIVVTGCSDIPTAVRAMSQGADHFLTKPIDPDSLAVIMRKTLGVGKIKKKESTRSKLSKKTSVFVGESKSMRDAWSLARTAAENDSTVLLHGETGSGKGIMARWIHDHSERRKESFVEVNCSSLGGDILSSTLFGHRKGAFTSAVENREGLIEVADEGTLFLDEIGDMDLGVQAQFLKVIEEKTFRRIGETKSRSSDFRLLCASNKNLKDEVEKGTFRQDLFYRICVFPIAVPPLRDCMGDLPDLVGHMLGTYGGEASAVHPDAMAILRHYAWPGNIRELSNVIERAGILAEGEVIRPEHLPGLTMDSATGPVATDVNDWSLDANEARHIQKALDHFHGDVPSAARAVGVSRATFYRKLKRYDILQKQE